MAAASSIDKTTDETPEQDLVVDEPVSTDAIDKVSKRSTKRGGKSKVEEQAEDVSAADQAAKNEAEERERDMEEARKQLEALAPSTEPRRWIVGKTPEHGGTEKQYSVYVQDKLAWMPRQSFFALLSRTLSDAIKSSGGTFGGLEDVLGEDAGSLIERGRRFTQRDMTDAIQFISLFLELIGYSDEFMVKAYMIILDVPRGERDWARERFSEAWDPDNGRYGLKDEDHEEIIKTFIDQNYEEVRRFFAVTLPGIGRRVALHERSRDRTADRKSD
jgi:hypothetical protein